MYAEVRETVRSTAVELPFDPDELRALCDYPMPFGRFEGCKLIDLPEPYVVWWKGRGFPRGKLGRLLGLTYEIKLNGLEPLVRQAAEALRAEQAARARAPRDDE